jgi:hypothetical protein
MGLDGQLDLFNTCRCWLQIIITLLLFSPTRFLTTAHGKSPKFIFVAVARLRLPITGLRLEVECKADCQLARHLYCTLQLLLVLASIVILGSDIRDSPNLESQTPVFIFPSYKLVRLHPQALGCFFAVSYDSQGCDGIIRTASRQGAEVEVTLRLIVNQSVCLGVEPTLGLATRY